jgi:hypothetical protein
VLTEEYWALARPTARNACTRRNMTSLGGSKGYSGEQRSNGGILARVENVRARGAAGKGSMAAFYSRPGLGEHNDRGRALRCTVP